MPRIWRETIEAHRHEVRDAVLDATAALATEHGLTAVTMSQIAGATGIGRATLYKYFPHVEAVLSAWHEREITLHLAYLAEVRDHESDAAGRLRAVLEAYALILHETRNHHATDVGAFLHRDAHVHHAQRQLHQLVRALLVDCAAAGELPAAARVDELAAYCIHALGAARTLASKAAVRRLVDMVIDALHPASAPP